MFRMRRLALPRGEQGIAGTVLLVLITAVVAVAVLTYYLGVVVEDDGDVGELADAGEVGEVGEQVEVTDVEEGQVPRELFSAVTLGVDKETLTKRLQPARPVDARVLEEYQTRSPETPASSCVYYRSEGRPRDELYRFCFEEDRLVDKAVVLPDEPEAG